MTRKFGDNYRYVKKLYPNAYKLPKEELSEMIEIARWHGDTLEEGKAELDKYIAKNEPKWEEFYFNPKQLQRNNEIQNPNNISNNIKLFPKHNDQLNQTPLYAKSKDNQPMPWNTFGIQNKRNKFNDINLQKRIHSRQKEYEQFYGFKGNLGDIKKITNNIVNMGYDFMKKSLKNVEREPLFIQHVKFPEREKKIIPDSNNLQIIDASQMNSKERENMLYQNVPYKVKLKPKTKQDLGEKIDNVIFTIPKIYDKTLSFYSSPQLGEKAVKQYSTEIELAAKKYNLDPDILRAIMYVENRDGHWGGLNALGDFFQISKSKMPMNIQNHRWSYLDGNNFDMEDPQQNIEAAALLIKKLQMILHDPNDIKSLGTLWNSLGAQSINKMGERIAYAYNNKSWNDPNYSYLRTLTEIPPFLFLK